MEHHDLLRRALHGSGEDFVRGVEIGCLLERLRCPDPVERQVRTADVELILRMSEATSRRLKADALDDTWLLARFEAPAWAAPCRRG
jgi:hypothetical protein